MKNKCLFNTRLSLIVFLAVCFLSVGLYASESREVIKRFAFVAGSNDGGPNRTVLKFAHSDAKSVAGVLTQLGGVQLADMVILLEPDRFEFEAGLSRMRAFLEREKKVASTRVELVFYYSGHSDEYGLMLGGDLITYREIRNALSSLPADVRIAILDSCSSGALVRNKGGTKRTPFLLDTSVDVEGYAYLTSASENEAAQESDRIAASFFTYYLVSGLRGAADHNRDNKVTLNEAYQYAFAETLARTELTQAGPQHAGYDFSLKGSGDLVLTDLRGTSAMLVIGDDIEGRVFIRNRKGQLTAEINTPGGSPISLGLDPGVYEISMDMGKAPLKGTVSLNKGRTTIVTRSELKRMSAENTILRGTSPIDNFTLPAAGKASEKSQERPLVWYNGEKNTAFRLGLVPGVNIPFNFGRREKEMNNLSLNIIGYGHELFGVEAGLVGNIRRFNVWGLQASFGVNVALENLRGAQFAGFANFILKESTGFKYAGFGNYSGGAFKGVSLAGGSNIVMGPFLGAELAGFVNMNKASAGGFQAAGVGNINGARSYGFQGAFVFNFNKSSMAGFQGSGVINISAGDISNGYQGSFVSNYAWSLNGLQMSSVVNIVKEHINGTQIGLINYAKEVKGAQIGLINIASKRLDGAAVGLINYAGNGILAPTVWSSDTSLINAGLKIGGPYLFGILGAGYHGFGELDRYSLIGGLGGHINFTRLWVELDLTANRIFQNYNWDSESTGYILKLRPVLGIRIIEQLSFYCGPTMNIAITTYALNKEMIDPLIVYQSNSSDYQYGFSIGYAAGLQWEPRGVRH